MYPVIHLGPLTLTGYWLMTVLGLLACTAYLLTVNRSGRLQPLEGQHLANLCFLSILSVFAGGKIMGVLVNLPDVIQHWTEYRTDFSALWTALTSGRAFYGGFVLLIVVFICYVRKYSLPADTVCALFVPVTALFMFFGRLGCFLGGCCYGIPIAHGIVFPEGSLAPSGVPLFPSQLAEAAAQLLLFLSLAILERRLEQKRSLISIYIACYSVIRFVLEFWRGDAQRGIWLLSSSQWVSLVLLLGVCVHYALVIKGRRTAK